MKFRVAFIVIMHAISLLSDIIITILLVHSTFVTTSHGLINVVLISAIIFVKTIKYKVFVFIVTFDNWRRNQDNEAVCCCTKQTDLRTNSKGENLLVSCL